MLGDEFRAGKSDELKHLTMRGEKIADVCTAYREAPARARQGERTVSTDEMTGVQALERAAPGLPLAPGKVERREFE